MVTQLIFRQLVPTSGSQPRFTTLGAGQAIVSSFARESVHFFREALRLEGMDEPKPPCLPAGRSKPPPFDEKDLVGLRHFRPIQRLLEHLHEHRDHPNRELHCDEYIALLLLYFFNPVLTSLRTLQMASDMRKVERQLGVRRASLGSLSEASQVFDAELLRRIVQELAGRAMAEDAPPRPKGVPDDLTVLAADGSLLQALPKMVWALWLGEHDHAAKIHLQFDLLRGVPADAEVTDGQAAETEALRRNLAAGRLYVLDRGYANYDLLQAIIDAQSSFLARLHANAVYEVIEERPVSPEAAAAGVLFDRVVWLGSKAKRDALKKPVRVIHVHVGNPPWTSRKPALARVSSKKTFRTTETEHDILLVTDRLDLPAETVALLYRYRWHVEIFFRWLKCTLNGKHLLAESPNGVAIQVYAALIASLLIVLWTGRKPNKYALTAIALYLQGWAELDELEAVIHRLPAAK